ncbi:MAG: DUF4870 domain-containing protein [Planctomycetaceae bacterium]
MISNELERLTELHREGALTADEFEAAKKKVLDSAGPVSGMADEIYGVSPKVWCTVMHMAAMVWWMGGLGVFTAVVMWLISREKSQMADRHGRVVVNWLLSEMVYSLISFFLTFLLIGIPMLWLLAAVSVIFPVIGAVRASEGRLWPYPLSIEFFSTAGEQQAEKT